MNAHVASIAPQGPMPAAAGIGLRKQHHHEVLDALPKVAWLEAHSENYFSAGGPHIDYLERIRAQYPLSLHGVGLSLGSADPLNREHLECLRRAVARFEPALVSESLSVSGILLGKTMGRGDDLADRFTGESKEIAGLEVRSRMAGRWVMSTIQFTFAIQPVLIYWLAGEQFGGVHLTIGTAVAFATLSTRLLFPIQSLLGVGPDIESSLALFDRIFEYLDLPIDIAEREDPVDLNGARGEVAFEDVCFRYSPQAPWTLLHKYAPIFRSQHVPSRFLYTAVLAFAP